MGLIRSPIKGGFLGDYLPLAAGSVLVLVFFHALLLWGDGLTVNINIISGGPHGSPLLINSTAADVEASQDILKALEAAAGGRRHVPRPLLVPVSAGKPPTAGKAGTPDTAGTAGAGTEHKDGPVTVTVSKISLPAPTADLAQKGSNPSDPSPSLPSPSPPSPPPPSPPPPSPSPPSPSPPPPSLPAPSTPTESSPSPERPKATPKEPKASPSPQSVPAPASPAAQTAAPVKPSGGEGGGASKAEEAPLPPGHKGDLAEVEKLKALMAPLAKDNTVVVTPANAGFLDLALNLHCRLKALGATNTLFWALDRESADKFEAEGIPHYYDASLFSISNAKGYHEADYIRMMSERPRVWWRFLATGYDFLFLDADVVAFDSPEKYFDRTADMEGQVDGWGWEFEKSRTNSSNLCAGAFWMRSSEKNLKFMVKAFESFADRQGKVDRWDDQLALNWIIHDKYTSAVISAGAPEGQQFRTDVADSIVKVVFAQPERILPGHLFWATQRTGSGYDMNFNIKIHPNDTTSEDFRPSLFHLNGHGKKSEKVNRLKSNGWWELTDDEKCR